MALQLFGCAFRDTHIGLVLGLLTLSLSLLTININTVQAFSDFQILAPESLRNNTRFSTPRTWDRNATGIRHLPALFGNPPYGDSIVANLFYPSQAVNQLGCQPFDLTNEPNWPSSSGENPTPYVLLLQRGTCSFKTKVRNAQNIGASVVIIFTQPFEYLVYMADDGIGAPVTTPSVLILNTDAQLLIAELNRTSTVQLAMSWSFEAPDDLVEWDLWTSSRDQTTFSFKQVFGAVEQALGNRTYFTPHYLFGTYSYATANSLCMNSGRYCTPDPNTNTPAGLLGRDVVKENLRQLCLYRVLNATGRTDLWWQYVTHFEQECSLASLWQTSTCGDNIITRLRVDLTQVNACINIAPLSPTATNTHPVIEQEIQEFRDAGWPFLPTVVINEEHYRGTIDCATPIDVTTCPILQALCSAFMDGTKPDVCFHNDCGFGIKKDCQGVCGGTATCAAPVESSSGVVSIGAVIGIVVGGMVFIGIGIVIYMKRQKQEITDGMDHMLRQYLPMEDGESINQSHGNGNGAARSPLTQHP